MELCKLVGTPRVGWAEREVHQLVKKAVPEQGAHLVDMRTEPDIDCTYALSGGGDYTSQVSERCCEFGRRAGCTSNTIRDLDEHCSQFGSVSPASEEADISVVSMPSASFYLDMSKLVESLVRNSTISAHQGHRKLQFFSGHIPTPGGEEGFES